MKTILVTGGDKLFDKLLKDCIKSIRDVGYKGDVAILDFGFSPDILDELSKFKVIIKQASLPPEISKIAVNIPKGAGVLLLKPYLPEIFPNYDRYIFFDADVYCQDIVGINALEREAKHADIVAISQRTRFHEWDVARGNGVEFNLFGQALRQNWYTMFANRSKLPNSDKKVLSKNQIINAGVFSSSSISPIWKVWKDEMLNCIKCLPVGRKSAADQLGLGLAIYKHNLKIKTLPEICNWMSTWRYDPNRNVFTETEPFYNQVSIMHLAGMSANNTVQNVLFPDEQLKPLDLTYDALIKRRNNIKNK